MISDDKPPQGMDQDQDTVGRRSGNLALKQREWRELEDVAMSFHGVMRLIDDHGFDNSSGAEELLRLAHRQLQKILSGIRERADGDSPGDADQD